MARPSRSQLNKAKRKKTREFKRGKPTIAKQKKVAIPTDKDLLSPQERVSTTKTSRTTTITPRRGRRIPKGALPAGPREILIVSRKGQPQIFTQIEPLERKSYAPISVSSSWLATIGYIYPDKIGTFTTKTGRQYLIQAFDFETFEEWTYAHSKGTFWNDFIRDQYTIVGTL